MSHFGFNPVKSGNLGFHTSFLLTETLNPFHRNKEALCSQAESILEKPFHNKLVELYIQFSMHPAMSARDWVEMFVQSSHDWQVQLRDKVLPLYNAEEDPGLATWVLHKQLGHVVAPVDFVVTDLARQEEFPPLHCNKESYDNIILMLNHALLSYHRQLASLGLEWQWRHLDYFSAFHTYACNEITFLEQFLTTEVPFLLHENTQYFHTMAELDSAVDLLLLLYPICTLRTNFNPKQLLNMFQEHLPRHKLVTSGSNTHLKRKRRVE